MYGTGAKYEYLQCSQCGCLQIIDPPKEISEYYPSDYYSFSEFNKYEKNISKKIIKNIRGRFFKLRGKFYLNSKPILRFFTGKFFDFFLPTSQPLASLRLPYFFKLLDEIKSNFEDKILDVGCGAGYGLILMHQYGYNNLTGIDPFIKQDIIYNQNVKILKKGFEEINSIYDIVLFQHSFEHMPEPSKVFEHLNLITDSNSNIIISIPVADSYAWQNYGANWVQIDAPRHYFIHTKKSIELLASAYGFYINKIKYDSSELQFWGSEQYKKGIPLRGDKSYATTSKNSIFTKSQIKGFKKQANDLNLKGLGDQAIFYLKKIS
jgi:SAM-dependent methyltransferase